MSPLQPAWNPHRVSADLHSLHQPKRDWFPHVLRDIFMTKLSKYPHVQAIHFYCDGSVNGSRLRSTARQRSAEPLSKATSIYNCL
ncbi:hypothetical protein E2C01_044722 [Portunus trituberculatus]|uniref:Uncharacterized protein n=1 Tax=Portunus trituberculatus TaxID=210409 RepID=A0A5B7G197_PORTR|nr:hypothetical protein [Portunus trituberculatus]